MRLSWPEIRANAAHFSEEWRDQGYEKGQTQSFYDEFFAVFGVPRKQVAVYEQRVKALDPRRTGGFIDLFWPGTLIVEQKSIGRNLDRAMTQALDYHDWLPEEQRPRHMMVCDFQRFELLDLETRQHWHFPLPDLKRHVEAFDFILGAKPRLLRNQSPVNRKATDLMGRLHNALAARGYIGHDLERLLVRLLFILFADDTGIFQQREQFLLFLETRTSADGRDLGRWLIELFEILDTPPERRQQGLDADLAEFPYINGALFSARIATPVFDRAMRQMLLDASLFNWGEVSPAIFGSLFESVIDKVTRRKQGAHYTPEEAILKVIGPLFLDDLRAEFDRACALRSGRDAALRRLQDRMAGLTFLDPACGAGNFLVVAYRELRELEREIIRERLIVGGPVQQVLDVADLTRLNVDRFHGMEIDEFPSQIAQVALWMTDHIANTRLGEDFGRPYARIPLVTAPNIRHCDALETDWATLLPPETCRYIVGNPPFIGAKYQTEAQRAQVRRLAALPGSGGTLDYVAAWFLKGARFAAVGGAHIAFVVTNSIVQGEQVAQLWPLIFREGMEITFAHRPFVWPGRAAVHCVIIGLAPQISAAKDKRLFSYADSKGEPNETRHAALNAYLIDAAQLDRHLVVKEEGRPINGARRLKTGVQMIDNGFYTFDDEERSFFLSEEPRAEPLFRKFIGGEEYINGFHRWILYLVDAPADMVRTLPLVRQRIAAVRQYRAASNRTSTAKMAMEPMRLGVDERLDSAYLVIPNTSSERRDYVPIGWLEPDVVANQKLRILPDATLWDFGILTSQMHMAWMRQISGRMKSDYMYSVGVVYNNFPWPDATPAQRAQVEALAQAVLDARALPKNATSTLADLYDPDTMPAELRRAHRDLDQAVDRLYRKSPFGSDRERVEHLFALYQALVDPIGRQAAQRPRRIRRKSGEG
ncbi:DNA methyltransferase [Sphingobium sp. YR768]|uniref:DNA methyltransferase n=1 Tax=Sphingobium sp. YR768 TaxID=1884365 RepID=UPI0008BB14F9|nr:DNA methyltransferase [Sphingobium sp. YR768]SER75147.1 Type II restriction/modification system, DNA methylase subunit YeeA [Sphingobium sp. YR768]